MTNNKQSSVIDMLKQDLDIEIKVGTKMIVNWDMYEAKHKREIKDGYNQGYRDGEHDALNIPLSIGDVSEYNNAEDYYNKTFKSE